MAAGDTNTYPFCGSCGWDARQNLNNDVFCDACGADLRRFLTEGQFAPTSLAAIPTEAGVTFTWIDNPDASSTESRFNIDAGTWSPWITDLSPTDVPAAAGEVVCIEVRSIVGGQSGIPVQTCASVLYPLATGATAGEPGFFTPPENRIPEDAGEMAGVAADPLTEWTEGQYVESGEGTPFYWNSATWSVGIAPAP